MLNKNPEKRYSARQVLDDPWFKMFVRPLDLSKFKDKPTSKLLKNLREFNA